MNKSRLRHHFPFIELFFRPFQLLILFSSPSFLEFQSDQKPVNTIKITLLIANFQNNVMLGTFDTTSDLYNYATFKV